VTCGYDSRGAVRIFLGLFVFNGGRRTGAMANQTEQLFVFFFFLFFCIFFVLFMSVRIGLAF